MRETHSKYTTLLSCLLVLSITIGCGQSQSDIARCQGIVLINGKPLNGGKVVFTPIANEGETEAGKPAYGILNTEGVFVLGTESLADGAVVATHRVTVSNSDPNSLLRKTFNSKKLRLKKRYTVVAGEENDFTIELTEDQ